MTTEAPIYEILRNAESQIKWQLFSCIPLFTLAVLIPLAAWNLFLIPSGESDGLWFQRSGSLTVLFAVWAEYNLMKVNEHVNPSGSVFSQQADLAERYQSIFKKAQYTSIALAVSGTFIWGYGDLLR